MAGNADGGPPDTEQVIVEELEIPSYKGKKGTKEVTLHKDPQLVKAEGDKTTSIIRYLGGISVIVAIALACLYIIIFDGASKAHDDAVKLLFLIAGGIMGSLYTTSDKSSS